MTFIASVIAKKGVAIIADSLVTSSLPILHENKFSNFLKTQTPNAAGEITLTPADIATLFEYQPSYTKDFEEKLFEFNKFTAITTTGIAVINGKKIINIVNDFKALKHDTIDDLGIPIETKIPEFEEYLTEQIKEHLGKEDDIGSCVFIFSFYETATNITHLFKLATAVLSKADLADPATIYLSTLKEVDWIKVVCDGQNKLSDNILYGTEV